MMNIFSNRQLISHVIKNCNKIVIAKKNLNKTLVQDNVINELYLVEHKHF